MNGDSDYLDLPKDVKNLLSEGGKETPIMVADDRYGINFNTDHLNRSDKEIVLNYLQMSPTWDGVSERHQLWRTKLAEKLTQ